MIYKSSLKYLISVVDKVRKSHILVIVNAYGKSTQAVASVACGYEYSHEIDVARKWPEKSI